MIILKTYQIQSVNVGTISKQIEPFVLNFAGISFYEQILSVLGDSILNEQEIDSIVANHNPKIVPESITPRQARQALFLNGITASMIEAAINQMNSPAKEMALIEWEFSTAFVRSNPLVNQIGFVFNKTNDEIDDIWILGNSL